jgi:hypothetical protein
MVKMFFNDKEQFEKNYLKPGDHLLPRGAEVGNVIYKALEGFGTTPFTSRKMMIQVVSDFLKKNPISHHQSGLGVDYRSTTCCIETVLKDIQNLKPLGINIHLHDERKSEEPHWHVSILS